MTPTGALTEAQSDAIAKPMAVPTPGTNDLLYIGNLGNNSITVYHHNDYGNVTPLRVIAGPKTKISSPGQLSEDAQGNLYVANGFWGGMSSNPAILVFAHGANGNVAPIRVLSGPLTGIHNVSAMTVDQATGKIFVADWQPGGSACQCSAVDVGIIRFPPNAAGNTAPFARAPLGVIFTYLTSDSTGNNLISSSTFVSDPYNGKGTDLDTFNKQFPNNGNLSFLYGIGAFGPGSIADDPTTKTYLVPAGGIMRLAENTVGNALGGISFTPPVVSVITSAANCGQLALGYLRNIYAVCGSQVEVFTHDSSGNVPPLRYIGGSATKLNQPYGIYEGQ